MALDGITMAALTKELKETLLEGRIHKIAQPEKDELLLSVKTKSGIKKLCLSASPSLPLLYLTQENKPSPMNAPNFCMVLRKYIGGGKITDITQPGLERILNISISHLDEMGDLCKRVLIVEMMGKHSNIILCREDGLILDSIRHISGQISSVREVLPGRTYFIPNTMGKTNPLTLTATQCQAILKNTQTTIEKAIYTSFTGISPTTARELCSLCDISPTLPAGALTEDALLHFTTQFLNFFQKVALGSFAPCIYYENGFPREFSPFPLSYCNCYTQQSFPSMSQVLYTYYHTKNTMVRIRQKSTDLRHIVQTALERTQKKYALQTKQLEDTRHREINKVYAELIHTYGYQLTAGAKSLTAVNYYNGETVTIPLQTDLTISQNATRYFEKYNKQKRTYEALTVLLQETKENLSYLESVLSSLELAETETELKEIRKELEDAGYLKKHFAKQGKKEVISSKPLHFLSKDGYHIYVGKNNLQNETVTFRLANGNDWWFHAKNLPGSHVIVKSNETEPPICTFEEAGRLAAYYSRGRNNDKVEIDYVQRKHLKKPKGAKPGFVIYHSNYSLTIDTDISNIKEIAE